MKKKTSWQNVSNVFCFLVPRMHQLGWKLSLQMRDEYDPIQWKAVWWRNAFDLQDASEDDYGFAKNPNPGIACKEAAEIVLNALERKQVLY